MTHHRDADFDGPRQPLRVNERLVGPELGDPVIINGNPAFYITDITTTEGETWFRARIHGKPQVAVDRPLRLLWDDAANAWRPIA